VGVRHWYFWGKHVVLQGLEETWMQRVAAEWI
jgi:hypothetical protein